LVTSPVARPLLTPPAEAPTTPDRLPPPVIAVNPEDLGGVTGGARLNGFSVALSVTPPEFLLLAWRDVRKKQI